MKWRLSLHKLRHWEYWPVWVVYLPCYFLYLYYAARTGHWMFFTVANPGIRHGGAFLVTKDDLHKNLPKHLIPNTLYINPDTTFSAIHYWKNKTRLTWPLLVKPNHGLRGLGLRLLHDDVQLRQFLQQIKVPYIVQEFVAEPEEVGIFFIKHPITQQVILTGIVQKEFMSVIGNGRDTIEQLLLAIPRYAMQLDAMRKEPSVDLQQILAVGRQYDLPKIGNHNRGTIFRDGQHLITPKLTATIANTLQYLPEIYYGRFDIKFDTIHNLENGHFKIIEINGVFSEPAHIYDPANSLLYAWQTLAEHFNYLFQISRLQIQRGHRPMSLSKGLALIRAHFDMTKRF